MFPPSPTFCCIVPLKSKYPAQERDTLRLTLLNLGWETVFRKWFPVPTVMNIGFVLSETEHADGPIWPQHPAFTLFIKFYICSSVYRNSMLKKSNKMQQYADIYLLLNYSTCFGRPSRPSTGVHKTVVAASGCFPDSMICARGSNYSFMYWWRARQKPETCRVI